MVKYPDGGIIPARAGFTMRFTPRTPAPRDHPRSRGVYAEYYKSSDGKAGSSPLARGLLDDNCPVTMSARIIPARAGFTNDRLS